VIGAIPEDEIARRLPLWRAWLDENEDTIQFGDLVSSKSLVDFMRCSEDSIQFAMAVSEIRRALRRKGMNFTARGQAGEGWVIAQPNTNHAEVDRMSRVASSALREAVVLGASTPLEMLTEEERKRHERSAQKVATRYALISRKQPTPKQLA